MIPPPTAPRSRMSGAQRRRQLIGVGLSTFAAKGLDGATIEEISLNAGVSKPVVYEHFGSKEGLYRAVVEQESAALLDLLVAALADETRPRILLERAASAMLGYIEERSEGFRILARDAPPGHPGGALSTILSRIAARVEHILSDEFKTRGFGVSDGAMYAQMLVGMVAMTGQWWLDSRSPEKEVVVAHVVNLAWNGLTSLEKEPSLVDG